MAFNFWTGVSTVAGALRRRVWIDELRFKWYANFYIVLVGPAGVASKSTAIAPGMRMLSKVDGVVFGPQSMTWQALVNSLAEASQDVTTIGPNGKPDITTTSPITIPVSEMGTFFKMEDSVMMDVLTALWDSPDGPWKHRTLSSGDTIIENPWLNVIACTTPTWLKTHFPVQMIGGGFASRVLFIYADSKRRLVPYPSREIRPIDYYEKETLLVEDLREIASLKGPYLLTDAAAAWGERWYNKHWTEQRPEHLASDRFSAYLSRKQTYIHKLAIILAASKREKLIKELEDLEESLELINSIEPSMLKVFESIGQVDEARRTSELIGYLRTYRTLTSSELWGLVCNVMTQKEFKTTLQAAVSSGQLQITTKDGKRAVTLVRRRKES